MSGNLVRMKRPRGGSSTDDHWIWRQAVQIVGQLPENDDDALAILAQARQLILTHQAELKPA